MSITPLTIDIAQDPQLCFRIDTFTVPQSAREEFEAAMRRNLEFLQTLPGFRSHMVFEQTAAPIGGGPTSKFNIITIAVWESPEAILRAGEQVRAYYLRIGFDMRASIAKWGVTAELGTYHAPANLQ
jgi:heme-degrading monooxygenase HmoA